MKILISGASGLIGNALVPYLRSQGHQVTRLLRSPMTPSADAVAWNPENAHFNKADFEGFDAVINLSGENIASGRWTEAKKKKLWESRVNLTKNLCQCLSQLDRPPKVLINASAIGFYGSNGSKTLTEESSNGSGFLADICREWENAAMQAKEKGIRVVCLRFGMVLSTEGGGLSKMLVPFKLGLGGIIGTGKQYISWIAIDDVLSIILFALQNANVEGALNVVTPDPVTNAEFTKLLGKELNRPTIVPFPEFIARLIFGEMADEVLLASTKAIPSRLQTLGYPFQHPTLQGALRKLLG